MVQDDKKSTARVALWEETKIDQVYTMEASFAGSSKNLNFSEKDYT